MCMICVEYVQRKLTPHEARMALQEFIDSGEITPKHADEVWGLIYPQDALTQLMNETDYDIGY